MIKVSDGKDRMSRKRNNQDRGEGRAGKKNEEIYLIRKHNNEVATEITQACKAHLKISGPKMNP